MLFLSLRSRLTNLMMRLKADGKDPAAKNPAAKALGAKGGAARTAKLTPEQRSEIAKNAAAKRWEDQNRDT